MTCFCDHQLNNLQPSSRGVDLITVWSVISLRRVLHDLVGKYLGLFGCPACVEVCDLDDGQGQHVGGDELMH